MLTWNLHPICWAIAIIVPVLLCPDQSFSTFERIYVQSHTCNLACDGPEVFLATAPCPPPWKLSLICEQSCLLNCSEVATILDRCIKGLPCDTVFAAFDSCFCQSNMSCPKMNNTLFNECPGESGSYSCQQPPATTTAMTTSMATSDLASVNMKTISSVPIDETTPTTHGAEYSVTDTTEKYRYTDTGNDTSPGTPVVNATIDPPPANSRSVPNDRCGSTCVVLVLLGTFVVCCFAVTTTVVVYQKKKRINSSKTSPSSTDEFRDAKDFLPGDSNTNRQMGSLGNEIYGLGPAFSGHGNRIGHQCSPFHVGESFTGYTGNHLDKSELDTNRSDANPEVLTKSNPNLSRLSPVVITKFVRNDSLPGYHQKSNGI